MTVLNYSLTKEMVPDNILEWVDELYVRMMDQDWHGMRLIITENGKFTIDVQMVVEEGGEK
jgi:hypothetical protein